MATAAVLSLLAPAWITPNPTTTVERWNRFELSLTGPSVGNPFVEVELSATFTLANSTLTPAASTSMAVLPLVSLDFAAGNSTTTPNRGTSAPSAPSAQLIATTRSTQVPAGSGSMSVFFGSDVSKRYVIELPGGGKPFAGGLAGLTAFTITGWLLVRGGAEVRLRLTLHQLQPAQRPSPTSL